MRKKATIPKNKECPEPELYEAVCNLHECNAEWVEAVSVKETFEGRVAWEGLVHVFYLSGHPTADRCYAWSHVMKDSNKRRFVAVLHEDPINSPRAAVQAAIVQEVREKE